MNRLSIRLLCIVALFSVATSCQKELSYEADTIVPAPSGTAVYTLAGAPGNCTAPIIAGTFREGVAAGDTNTIVVQVAVTDTGTYSITSNTVNGITFTSTGSFSTTGQQTIVFQANGTPATGGTFSFILGAGGCSFEVNCVPSGVVPVAGCKDCVYIPICPGTKYEFADTMLGIGTTRLAEIQSLEDTTIDGKPFKKVKDLYAADSYYSCVNGESTVVGYTINTVQGNTVTKFESIMLKANAADGTTWQSTFTNPTGQKTIQDFSIVGKNLTINAGPFTFNNVIQLNMDTGIEVPGVGALKVTQTDYYYAQGVGLVLTITRDYNTGNEISRSVIKSYFIPG